MSFRARLIGFAIKWMPKFLVLWVANWQLKGIARLMDFSLDLDLRRAYAKTRLFGEDEVIEVLVEGFYVASENGSYHLFINQAQSNRAWLVNLLARIVGRAWKIPVTPQLMPYIKLIAELLKPQR